MLGPNSASKTLPHALHGGTSCAWLTLENKLFRVLLLVMVRQGTRSKNSPGGLNMMGDKSDSTCTPQVDVQRVQRVQRAQRVQRVQRVHRAQQLFVNFTPNFS